MPGAARSRAGGTRSGRAAAPGAHAAGRPAARSRDRQQLQGGLGRTGLVLGVRGVQRPSRTAGGLGGQLGRPLQERRRGGQPAAGTRPSGRTLQLGGGLLVGAQHRLRAVPGAPVGVAVRRWHRPARRARGGGPAAWRPGRPPSAPADGGTAPGRRSSAARRPPRARPLGAIPRSAAARHSSAASPVGSAAATSSSSWVSAGRSPERRWNMSSIRRGTLIASGSSNPPARRAGDALRGSSSSARGLPRASATIRSRTPSSSGVRTAAASSARASLSPSPSRRSSGNPVNEPAPPVVARVAQRDQQRHPLGRHPPRHERQHLRGRLVQPLRVVDEAQQRPVLGDLGQQVEDGQPDQEPVRRRHRPAARTPRPRAAAAARAARRAGPAAARTAGAGLRTRTGSRTPPRPSSPPGTLRRPPRRGRAPAAPSCRCRPHLAPPAPRSARREPRRAARSTASRSTRRPTRSTTSSSRPRPD